MIWGMTGGGWMGGLLQGASDRYRAELELLAAHGLRGCEWSARSLMQLEPARREEIAGWLCEFDVYLVLGIGFDYFASDPDERKRGMDAVREQLDVLPKLMRAPICCTGLSRRYHRFTRKPSLSEQLDMLSERMAPLAEAARGAGCPVGVHNTSHYGRDLAELCRRTPHLGMLFDTGNPFLIGEPPVLAAQALAPYTIGTHFKDHYVEPGFDPLCLKIRGAVPGEGDAGLKEVYGILMEKAPQPDGLVMLMEIDPVEGMTQKEALPRALEFVRSLPAPSRRSSAADAADRRSGRARHRPQ